VASLEDPLFFFFEIYLCTAPDRDCREREREREGGGGQVEIERNYHSEKEKGKKKEEKETIFFIYFLKNPTWKDINFGIVRICSCCFWVIHLEICTNAGYFFFLWIGSMEAGGGGWLNKFCGFVSFLGLKL